MPLRCFFGLHRWRAKSYLGYDQALRKVVMVTENRCARPGCTRYPKWAVVDIEPRSSKW